MANGECQSGLQWLGVVLAFGGIVGAGGTAIKLAILAHLLFYLGEKP